MGITVAAFDLDGTLTRRDTLMAFGRFLLGEAAWVLSMLHFLPDALAFRAGLIGRQEAKERLLCRWIGGRESEAVYARGEAFGQQVLPGLLRPQGLARLRWHRAQGHRCFLVSASLDVWLRGWAASEGLELICSRAEVAAGRTTGKLAGLNCHGPEKVRRLQAVLEGQEVAYAYAYGDSQGDKELLAWASEAHWRPFRS